MCKPSLRPGLRIKKTDHPAIDQERQTINKLRHQSVLMKILMREVQLFPETHHRGTSYSLGTSRHV